MRAALDDVLGDVSRPRDGVVASARAVFARRSLQHHSAIGALVQVSKSERLSCDMDELAEAYVHMSMNRFLRSEHRMHELVIYDSPSGTEGDCRAP